MSANVIFEDFCQVFDDMMGDIQADERMGVEIPDTLKRLEKVLRYNCLPKVKLGGFLVPKAYSEICGDTATSEQLNLAYKLGWCFRFIQGFVTMLDDYMDNDQFRFGKPNWFGVNNHKRIAINDMVLVEQAAKWFTRKYFAHLPIFHNLVEYFDSMTFEFTLGQNMEHGSTSIDDPELSGFTMAKYETCIRYTNLRFLFVGAIHLALILAGIGKEDLIWHKVENVCINLTAFWAARDDLNDSFGDDQIHAVLDTDIKLGTNTWLISKAREISSPTQWATLKDNYGKDDEMCVARVKSIFLELDLPALCRLYMKSLHAKVTQESDTLIAAGHSVANVILMLLQYFGNVDE